MRKCARRTQEEFRPGWKFLYPDRLAANASSGPQDSLQSSSFVAKVSHGESYFVFIIITHEKY